MIRTTAFLLVLLFTLPAFADQAKDSYKRGKEAEARNEYVAAFEAYQRAWELKPKNVQYRMSMQRMRFLAAATLVHQGQLLREGGKLQEALANFQRAAQIDPSSFIAQQEIRRTQELLKQAPGAPATGPPAAQEPSVLRQKLEAAGGPVELAPITDVPITLRLTEDTKVIYETIGKLAGINVLFDPDYTPRRIKIELNGVTLEQALNLLALESKTFWRPVTSNTIFVAADTTAKRRELEQTVVKTFYLSNLSQPTELQDVINVLRTVVELTRVQPVASQAAIVARGTPDQLALAEKLVSDLDKAKSEVIIEVAVMQVRRDKLRELGISPPTRTSIQLQGTTTGTGNQQTTSPNTINLDRLGDLRAEDFVVTIPGATANFLLTDSNTKIIQNPQIRALDGQKASLKIGDRVPVATGSFQPGIGGVGINPLVNTQFQYIDVGVNIDITPRVHAGREVTLKIMIDISSVTSRVNIGGIDQPVIGQRKVEHEIRLAAGEANLLGGILEEQDVRSLTGIPGLAQIPLLRYLFSSERTERQENEIIFLIVPHVVRGQELTPLNQRAIAVGHGSGISLSRAANAGAERPAAAPPQAQRPAPTQVYPAPAQPGPAQPQPTPAPAPPETRPPEAPSGTATLRFEPATITAAAGSTFAVSVALNSPQEIYSVPLQIAYDPSILQLVNVSNGEYLSRDGQPVALVHRIDGGTLQVSATRPPGAVGLSGEGTVFTLTFVAKQPGQSALEITRAQARDAAMQAVPVTPARATVTVATGATP